MMFIDVHRCIDFPKYVQIDYDDNSRKYVIVFHGVEGVHKGFELAVYIKNCPYCGCLLDAPEQVIYLNSNDWEVLVEHINAFPVVSDDFDGNCTRGPFVVRACNKYAYEVSIPSCGLRLTTEEKDDYPE